MSAPVIHICGWAGCGKATIGRVLARRLGGRLIDNHLMIDPAAALFERGTPGFVALRAEVRRVIHAAARDLPGDVPLIVTDALADSDGDRALFGLTQELAKARGAELCAVTLMIDAEENRRRLVDPAREGGSKLTDPAVLDQLRATHRLLRPEGAVSVDVTTLSPEAAASAILAALSLSGVSHA
ncbi:AAA family ATPase [Antarctobacter jejuensis]|uniref:AAA family ATPase n=1 Tax=Antarctobacter jejuensis TaxID=1439938 RepID=UPI003FCFDE57